MLNLERMLADAAYILSELPEFNLQLIHLFFITKVDSLCNKWVVEILLGGDTNDLKSVEE
jgi:hypothetical protein